MYTLINDSKGKWNRSAADERVAIGWQHASFEHCAASIDFDSSRFEHLTASSDLGPNERFSCYVTLEATLPILIDQAFTIAETYTSI